ncbi:DUF4148 domain-containing protein [Variovorax sp. E3]|uniref:DUF4148 domain-containing protein n=1 Tax=Variovorax sp. E3 TaxID=1914993 RepID=UPI0018DBF1A4|nr:DUF4148 domain-containing protein [Variovorax sp. E3]
MNLAKAVTIASIPVLTLPLSSGAHAEAYDGVHGALSTRTREEVNVEAMRTAAAPDQNVVRGSRGPETIAVSKERSLVEAEAIRAAWAPDQNVGSGSRVNSKVISTMPHPADRRTKAD